MTAATSEPPRRPVFDPTGPLDGGATLLEASAGTGKTFTITSLVLRLVAEVGIDLREILVVTFTRAATAELRDRIRRRLVDATTAHERALADPDWRPDPRDEILVHLVAAGRDGGEQRLREQWQRLVAAQEVFDDATIATIHGFCQETLHHSAFESDADFDVDLLEDIDEILDAIVHDTITAELRTADPDWYAHLRAHKVDRDHLLDLARRVEAEPDIRILPADPLADPEAAWADVAAEFKTTWHDGRDAAVAWLREQRDDGALHRLKDYREQLDDTIDAIDAWCDGVAARFADVWAKAKLYTTAELSKRTKDDYEDHPIFAVFDRLVDLGGHPATAFKVRFVHQVRDELDRRKSARNVLSFNDLLHRLRRALTDPGSRDALAATLRTRYRAALIDEFQDTDPTQWAIFDTVFGDHGHLYLIGDPKQAIYAFRGADVHTYLRAATAVAEQATLATNWRSDARYVGALNDLFAGSPAEADGEAGVLGTPDIEVDPVAAADLHDHDRLRFPDGDRPALRLLHVPRTAGPGNHAVAKHWLDREVPRQVAADIVAFLTSGGQIETDAGRWRDVLPRDVAVLTRTNAQAQAVQGAPHEVGVHAVATGGGTVFETHEATALQRLLDALLHPGSERDAKAAVITPLLGVDASTLLAMPESDWEARLDQLAAWSQVWRDHGVVEAVRQILDHGGRERLLRLPSGERRLTNVLHLLELAHTAERAERLGPTGLAAWLRERRHDPRPDRDATELRLESDADAVTIVTVHRAKGLEYPVVWCPYLWEAAELFPGEDRNLRFHDPDDGHALTLDLHVENKREPKDAHRELAKTETWQERLRLLYVALTRAQHQCTVTFGALAGYGKSPLGRVLHGFDGSVTDSKLPSDEELLARVRELADGSDGRIGIETVAAAPPTYTPPAGDDGELAARTFTRQLDRLWTRSSFTALTRARDHADGAAFVRDVDATTEPDARELAAQAGGAAAADGEPVPLADFPRGAAAGTFLHDVLERFDFTAVDEPGALDALVADQLARHRLPVDDPGPVAAGLRAVLDTPLGPALGEVRLRDVAPSDRLNELTFDLPLAGGYAATDGSIDVHRIADVFARHAASEPVYGRAAERLRHLDRRTVRGFLTGSIDLVLRRRDDGHDRFHVIDHKSNWHGDRGVAETPDRSTVGHYHPDALTETMLDHHYLLQAHLYLVALHRFLRWRLGATYRYDDHVGGIAYLFLRGMVGAETPRAADGTPHGVWTLRPPCAVVEDLDAALAGEVPA